MAAANAQIGVARAAYYPSLTLGPSIGYDSRTFGALFDAPSLLWSLGLSAVQPSSTPAAPTPTSPSRKPATSSRWPTTAAWC
jgi:outer membrane protein TolC